VAELRIKEVYYHCKHCDQLILKSKVQNLGDLLESEAALEALAQHLKVCKPAWNCQRLCFGGGGNHYPFSLPWRNLTKEEVFDLFFEECSREYC